MRYRYNNVPTDVGGRYFYINDGGEVWNPSFAPTKTALDSFECRHGLGYTRITSERKGVRAALLMFVPQGHTAEVHELRIKNTTAGPKSLKVFSFIEWCLWNAYDDMTNYQRNFRPERSRLSAAAAPSITRPSTASGAITTRSTT